MLYKTGLECMLVHEAKSVTSTVILEIIEKFVPCTPHLRSHLPGRYSIQQTVHKTLETQNLAIQNQITLKSV